MMRTIHVLAVLFLLTGAGAIPAFAEELVGVPVYPGAKLDDATTEHLEEALHLDGAAYRTKDSAEKVVAYYTARGYREHEKPGKGRTRLSRGDVLVTVQGGPRRDHATRKTVDDTLLTIVHKD